MFPFWSTFAAAAMDQGMSELGQSLIAAMKEALAYARGEPVPGLRVHVIEVPVADDADADSDALKQPSAGRRRSRPRR